MFTHDSIGLGEDGPTHQPVEHLTSLRAVPGLVVLRPADPNETAAAWAGRAHPTRRADRAGPHPPAVPTLPPPAPGAVARGAYVRVDGSDVVIVATGSEVHLGLTARDTLAAAGISTRVVSMPSWELFDEQPSHYRDAVLPPGVPRLGVEAGRGLSWCHFTDDVVSVESFGASAPAADLFETFGLTPDHIAHRAEALIARRRGAANLGRGAG